MVAIAVGKSLFSLAFFVYTVAPSFPGTGADEKTYETPDYRAPTSDHVYLVFTSGRLRDSIRAGAAEQREPKQAIPKSGDAVCQKNPDVCRARDVSTSH